MIRAVPLALLLLLAPPAAPLPDAFGPALKEMGIAAADLGYRPKAHWARYPHPRTVPSLLPWFEDLHANPLDTYEFTRLLANGVEDLLTPEKLREDPKALYRLGVNLGTDRLIGAFRGYGANLDPRPEKDEPLYHALVRLIDRSGTRFSRDVTFGKPADWTGDPVAALRKKAATVPEALHAGLANLVLALIDAREWIDRGLRHVTEAERRAVFATLPALHETTGDGTRYFPVLDDVAAKIDAPSLYYGCLKALKATQDARRALLAIPKPEKGWPEFDFRLETAWGTISFDANPVNQRYVPEPLLIVRFGPGNSLDSPAGATSPARPLSVALLLDSGGRVGESYGVDVSESSGTAQVASGILGCGIVYASGKEDHHYRTGRWGLGAGLFGMGVLADEGGDDHYSMAAAGLGTGYLGIGLLLDAAGNDEYSLAEGDGEGLGFPGGVGVLADRSGNDVYRSEADAKKAGRGDYHSAGAVAVSNAQGAGCGRRGDGSDGHCRAGGLGALLDIDGDDRYEAGNFSQGIGYWYGTGLLFDGGGDDRYESVYFTQGSGAHFAIGALIDESGNDAHVLGHNAGAAFAFGWDVVNAFLIDRGTGNDLYDAKIISTGLAEVRSNAFFLDEGGDDTYILSEGQRGFGDVDVRKEYTTPERTRSHPFHLSQVGVFLDLSGKDRYLRRAKDGSLVPDREAGDDRTWHLRRRDPAAPAGPNVSIARDLPAGRLGFLDPWPARKPGGER